MAWLRTLLPVAANHIKSNSTHLSAKEEQPFILSDKVTQVVSFGRNEKENLIKYNPNIQSTESVVQMNCKLVAWKSCALRKIQQFVNGIQ